MTADDGADVSPDRNADRTPRPVDDPVLGEMVAPSSLVQNMLQGALSQMNTAVLLWDEQWRLVFTNAVGATMFEVRHPVPVGKTIWELNPNWESTPFSGTARRAITKKEVASSRHFSQRLSRWFEMVAYPTDDGLVVYMQDVTAEETAQSELAESVKRLRSQAALLDAARDAIFVRDLDHRITYWNRGAERLYGWTAEETIGRTSRELIYRNPGLFDAAHAEVTRVGHWEGELEHFTIDGRAVIVDCRWQMLTDEDDQPFAVMCVNSDITEYKREQAKWYREQRMESLGMLAGGIAHDLNNVFTPILLTSQILAAGEEDDQRRELLESMQSSVERGADMIRQVLSFARGEEVQRSLIDVHVLVDQLHAFARSSLPPAIRLETNASEGLWTVSGDSTQLLQVLINLVTNARDAMTGGGLLTITTRNVATRAEVIGDADDESAVPGWVVVEVEDTGCGMDPDTLDRLFEPFFTTKPLGSGTGLGLSTSLAIARGHGGDIEVYSEPGRGTRFRVRLPAAIRDESVVTPAEPIREEPRGRGERVLIVDDETTIRGIVQQALEKNGYRTVLAGNGIEAIDVLTKTDPLVDLVFTDMMMPGMDGAATAAFLYEHHPDIPVIAASGLTANEGVARAANPGVRHFLAKPFSKSELLDAVDGALHGDSNDYSKSQNPSSPL